MSIQLNHTIVRSGDKHASAKFLADLLGLPVGDEFGPFVPIKLANGATLDYLTTTIEVVPQHYAFLVDDDEFDAAFNRITTAGLDF